MIKRLSFLFFILAIISAKAQPIESKKTAVDTTVKAAQPYGEVDVDDLKLKQCDFEPDANAEVLFDEGDIIISSLKSMKRHVRIKIFNDFGKKYASIRFLYHAEFLAGKAFTDIDAETINLEGDAIVKTPIDRTQIYTNKIDDYLSEIVFTMPNVKAGSVIEYKFNTYPERIWNFQGDLPERLSEVTLHYPKGFSLLKVKAFVKKPFYKERDDDDKRLHVFALANVHSLPNEPFMTARKDNLQRMRFENFGFLDASWNVVAGTLSRFDNYNFPDDAVLPGQQAIINKVNETLSDAGRIEFLFDTIKSIMKWNGKLTPLPQTGLREAWNKRTGNSTEINLILLHFLRQIGLKACPTIVATKGFGIIDPLDADLYGFNNTIVTVPTDSVKYYYALDASNKYNVYNETPYNILNTYGIRIYSDQRTQSVVLENNKPAQHFTSIEARLLPDGKVTGTASITSNSYHKAEYRRLFDKLDQKTYLDSAFKIDNTIKVISFKFDNNKDINQPLVQEMAFTADLNDGESNYLYFKTNLFFPIRENPFKKEERFSDVDLRFGTNYAMSGIYAIPDGFKADALPRSITIVMPDESIIFKRTVAQDDRTIVVRYSISYGTSIYKIAEYQNLRGFYNRLFDLLNEQIVLKKQ
jgi:hypothetical protein